MTALDIITNALSEIGAYSPGESVSSADAAFSLSKLNRLFDQWNALKRFVYAINFTSYTIVPTLQPATIGPDNATYTVAQRPVKIVNANIIINNGTPVRVPLAILDDDGWNAIRTTKIQTTLPVALYYSPDWPNGSLWLWPIPTVPYLLELETWTLLGNFPTLTTRFSMPPGYEDGVTYQLALSLCPAFERAVPPVMSPLLSDALQAIQGLNSASPSMITADFTPPGVRQRPYFNWYNGWPW